MNNSKKVKQEQQVSFFLVEAEIFQEMLDESLLSLQNAM